VYETTNVMSHDGSDANIDFRGWTTCQFYKTASVICVGQLVARFRVAELTHMRN